MNNRPKDLPPFCEFIGKISNISIWHDPANNGSFWFFTDGGEALDKDIQKSLLYLAKEGFIQENGKMSFSEMLKINQMLKEIMGVFDHDGDAEGDEWKNNE